MNDSPREHKAVEAEAIISGLLQWGVTASLVLLLAGTLICFAHPGTYGGGTASDLHRMLAGGPAFPRTATWLLHGLAAFDGTAVIVLGLLLLIATPVIRVAVSIWVFAVARDRAYVAITAVVLFLLLLSFYLGKAG